MIPKSPTRWEREQKATFLSLLILVGLVALVAYCTEPSPESAVAHEVGVPNPTPPIHEEGSTP